MHAYLYTYVFSVAKLIEEEKTEDTNIYSLGWAGSRRLKILLDLIKSQKTNIFSEKEPTFQKNIYFLKRNIFSRNKHTHFLKRKLIF